MVASTTSTSPQFVQWLLILGNPDEGIPSDPTNGAYIDDIGDVSIDIAYGGSCTAGKIDDIAYYAQVCQAAKDQGLSVKEGVDFYIQYGSGIVKDVGRFEGLAPVVPRCWRETHRSWLRCLHRSGAGRFDDTRPSYRFCHQQKFPRPFRPWKTVPC